MPRDTVKGNIFSVDFSKYSKVGDVLRHIKRDWVDTVNLEKLEEDAIIEILENLDPPIRNTFLPMNLIRPMNT